MDRGAPHVRGLKGDVLRQLLHDGIESSRTNVLRPFIDIKGYARDLLDGGWVESDVDAFCGWLKRKIEGKDQLVLFYLSNEAVLRLLYSSEAMSLGSAQPMQLLTREHAQAILAKPETIRKDSDAVVIDDHRWVHMWGNALKDKKDLFLTKEQLRRLHQIYVDEFMRRGFNHQSPLSLEINLMGDQLMAVLGQRQSFLVDPSFICYVGSSVSDKPHPRDVDVLFRSAKCSSLQGSTS